MTEANSIQTAKGTFDELKSRLLQSHPRDEFNEREWQRRQNQAALDKRSKAIEAFRESIGLRYRNLSLNGYEQYSPAQQAPLAQLREFCDGMPENLQRGESVFLYGPSGTGKDHLAIAAMGEAVSSGVTCLVVKGLELFSEVREAIQDSRTEKVVKKYVDPQVLLLSDPAMEMAKPTDFNYQTLVRLIDRRYEGMKSTWITLNCKSREHAIELLGGPVFDRLMDGALTINCNWPSYRERRKLRKS